MKNLTKKTSKKVDARQKDIKKTANYVFEQYRKSFKDLARYDRGEKIVAD